MHGHHPRRAAITYLRRVGSIPYLPPEIHGTSLSRALFRRLATHSGSRRHTLHPRPSPTPPGAPCACLIPPGPPRAATTPAISLLSHHSATPPLNPTSKRSLVHTAFARASSSKKTTITTPIRGQRTLSTSTRPDRYTLVAGASQRRWRLTSSNLTASHLTRHHALLPRVHPPMCLRRRLLAPLEEFPPLQPV